MSMNTFLKMNINISNIARITKQSLKCIATLFLFVYFAQDASATHIVGGEITYRCLGNNRYEIILTVYRDCFFGNPNVGFDDPAWLGFYRTNGNLPVITLGPNGVVNVPYDATDTLDEQLTSECNILGQDVCVHRAVYRTVVTLPQVAGGYTIVYQRCCRNETLQNIEVPLNTGAVFSVVIGEQALATCNSSPRYDDWPPIYVCAGKPLNYDHSATDDDGDVIEYRLCTPVMSGDTAEGRIYPPPPPPFPEVTWASGFSLDNLLGGSDPLKIDPSTGLITGTPTIIGQFLVGVCAYEFKNGVGGLPTSIIRRDFQYNVRDCTNPTDACFEIPDTLCNTKTVAFKNCSQSTIQYEWTFYNAQGGVLSTSTEFEPVITYPDYGTYRVRLIAADGPACVDTMDRNIVISPTTINADFSLSVPACGDVITIKTTNTSAGASSYQWFVIKGGTQVTSSTDFQPEFNVNEDGNYTVVLIAFHQNGCSDTIQKNINVKSLSSEVVPDEFTLCLGESVALNPNGDPTLQYSWSPATFLTPGPNVPNPTSTPTSNITYFVDILDAESGCTFRDTVDVKLTQEPGLDWTFTNDCGVLTVDFVNLTATTQEYLWDFGDGIGTSTETNPTYTYLNPGTYMVKLTNTNPQLGCIRVDSMEVKVNFIDVESVNDSIYSCGNDTIFLNPNGSTSYSYVWQPADKIIGSNTVANPQAIIDGFTVFTVTISDPVFDDCTVEGRVVADLTKLTLLSETPFVCEGETTTIGITLTGGTGTPTIVWTPDINIISGQGTTEITVLGVQDMVYNVSATYTDTEPDCVVSGSVSLDVGTYGGAITAGIAADSIYDSETVQLFAEPSGLEYIWSPAEGLDNPNAQNPIYTPGDLGEHIFTVTVKNDENCTQSASVKLVVRETLCDEKHIFLPNAFSPNGDGQNEVLSLLQDGIADPNRIMILIIYNRFGQQVFATGDHYFKWDGTFNGKTLDPDVYGFYLFLYCIDGQQFTQKGNITIIK